jgi:polar amino acid transport system permease protein
MIERTLRLVVEHQDQILSGLRLTLELTVIGEALALCMGLAIGLGRLSRFMAVRAAATAYVEFFRDTPFLIQLFWVYYCLPMLGIVLDEYTAAILCLMLYLGAYNAEVIRAGIQSVHKGQVLAARGLGMSHWLALRRIVLPQAVRMMTPPLLSCFINLIKATSMTSTITVMELTAVANHVSARTFQSLEIFTAIGILYFCIIHPLNLAVTRFEARLQRRAA